MVQRVVAGILILVGFSLQVETANAQASELDLNKVKLSVVKILAHSVSGEVLWTGTGFAVAKQGVVATNFHVLDGAHRFTAVTAGDEKLSVTGIWSFDKKHDIALIQLSDPDRKGNLPVLHLAEDASIKLGNTIFPVGHPNGLDFTVSKGIISSVDRTLKDIDPAAAAVDILQTDATTSPGSSGGPWIDEQGRVVAVHCSGARNYEFNFGCPAKHLRELTERQRKTLLDTWHFSKGARGWMNLVPIKKGDLSPFADCPELEFAGHRQFPRNEECDFRVEGNFQVIDQSLVAQGQRPAVVLMSAVKSFEAEATIDGGHTGGLFILLGWKNGSGTLLRNVAVRQSVGWDISQIREGKLVEGSTVGHDTRTRLKGVMPVRISVTNDEVTLTVGKSVVVNKAKLSNYEAGEVILGTFPCQYGPRPISVSAFKWRTK